ncbi:hypothetical protein [Streptomyces sp. NPDC093094]|uniref:hypothetical protein n=1 Tax=Streptomyces sp. NPDC093094 TaxID=3366026 RepID=UPI003829409C
MGALRRIWNGRQARPAGRGAPGRRGRRVTAALALAVLSAAGAAACDPVGGLSTATVAYTTDQLATGELERRKADVRWLTCTARVDGGGASPSATADDVATVDCQGETGDGKDITVAGKVTRAVDGACVRGDLTAKIDGKEWFHVQGLGNCDATGAPPAGVPRPGVTVTVTETVWCDRYPQCRPVEGK